jgi:hypothetical protein
MDSDVVVDPCEGIFEEEHAVPIELRYSAIREGNRNEKATSGSG